jgi:hypothetical protein
VSWAGHSGSARRASSGRWPPTTWVTPRWSPLATLRALDPSTPSGAFVGPAKFGQLRGRPELLDVYASANDPATAARLWKLTEEALGNPVPLTAVDARHT